MWWFTHRDRIELNDALSSDPTMTRQRRRLKNTVAWRNEVVSAILATSFFFYSMVGTITVLRRFEFFVLPFEPGLLTMTFLVFGNFLEMCIAIVLVESRLLMNREEFQAVRRIEDDLLDNRSESNE
jgi:hypothetical protein